MPLDPSIALSVKTPEVRSPLQTIGGLMQLRSQITENALRAAQVETQKQHAAEYEQLAEQKRVENQSVQKLTDMMRDPTAQQEFASGKYDRLWQSGISPSVANPFIENHQKFRLGESSIETAEAVPALAARKDVETGVEGVKQASPETRQESYAGMRSNVIRLHPKAAAILPETIPAGDEGLKTLDNIHIDNLTRMAVIDQALKRREGTATAEKTEAERKKIEAETPGIAAASGQKVIATDASHLLTATDQASYDALRAEMPFSRAKAFPDVFDPAKIRAAALTPEESKPQFGTEVPFPKDVEAQKARLAAAGRTSINAQAPLSPEATEIAAEMYAKTGQLPALGMGNAAMRAAIMNRAGELHKGLDLATQSSAFAANKASLTGLQKNLDAVTAFEKTAGKNLDLLLTIAPKIVDANSPWINTPLREVNQKLLGSADLSAYNAARQVAINEIAKVTSNPTLAGQLSDAARKEVENFIPANATLKQTMEVAKVLKQDMENRRTSYQEQVQDIQRRIGAHPGEKTEETKKVKVWNSASGKFEER